MTRSETGQPRLRGADPDQIRTALRNGEPLPGTTGFAGPLDCALVRDVLGRVPLFSDAPAGDCENLGAADYPRWSHDPTDLDDPVRLPAGSRRTATGDRRAWSLPATEPTRDRDAALAAVRRAVLDAVDAVHGGDDLAVAFSGGVDSSLLAARLDAPLYVTGLPDSPDVHAARAAADRLDADLRVVDLDIDAIEAAIPRVVAATCRRNPMDVGIALPLCLVAEAAAADGAARLALGQGADELFGGYQKVANAATDERVAADTVRGARREMVRSLPAQFERDTLAVRAAGIEPVAPLAHDDVVAAALSLPGDLLVGPDGTRKRALRLAAAEVLPEELAFRDKRAMQYGTRVARELDRLARQAGFKRRMDDHVGRYLRDRCELPVAIRDARDAGTGDRS